jgi:outer membrane protein, protease secretion system
MTAHKPAAGVVMFMFLGAASMGAQEIPSRLTLDDALRIAEARNPSYLRAQQERDATLAGGRRSMGAFLPSLSVSAGVAGASSRTLTGEDNFGRPVALPEPIDYTRSSTQQGVTLNYTLLDGGTRVRELRASQAEGDAAQARVRAEAARLRGDVARRYYDVLLARDVVELQHALLQSAQDQLMATREMLRVAASDPVDVLGAEVEVASREQAAARAQADFHKARMALAELLGLPLVEPFELADDMPAPFDPSSLEVEELVAAARASNPAVLQAEASVRAAQHSAAAARASRWPILQANAGLSRAMSLGSMDALTELNPQNRSLNFGFSAQLPLFTQFRASALAAETQARARGAQLSAAAQVVAVEREVRAAVVDLESAHRSVLLAERSAQLSRERVELARDRYRIGTLGFIELQGVLDRAAQAERALLDARHAFAAALASLEERVGREVGAR